MSVVLERELTRLMLIDEDTGEVSVNPLYIQLYNISLKCLLQFGCPVIYYLYYKKPKLMITFLVSSLVDYEMTVRYLTTESQALIKQLPTVQLDFDIQSADIKLTKFSLDEIESFNEIKDVLQERIDLNKKNKYILN